MILHMLPFNDDARFSRMVDWSKVIATEVADDLQAHHIFWEVQAIIRSNPRLMQTRSHFFEWMGDVFVASAASAVRRQVDAHKDSICLRRLLKEMIDYPHVVTRDRYLGVCGSPPPGEPLREMNDHAFDEWAGVGGNHIDADYVRQDLQMLLDTCDGIRNYVNKRVAHYDKDGITPTMMPTFQDLEDACTLIERLTQKYHLIFTGIWLGQVRPTIAYPWTDIFQFAWIPAPSSEVH